MRKLKDWEQPYPNPDCTHYRRMNRGNSSVISTYAMQSRKRCIFPVQRLQSNIFRDS